MVKDLKTKKSMKILTEKVKTKYPSRPNTS